MIRETRLNMVGSRGNNPDGRLGCVSQCNEDQTACAGDSCWDATHRTSRPITKTTLTYNPMIPKLAKKANALQRDNTAGERHYLKTGQRAGPIAHPAGISSLSTSISMLGSASYGLSEGGSCGQHRTGAARLDMS